MIPSGVYCKGSYALGTACGECERCKRERCKRERFTPLIRVTVNGEFDLAAVEEEMRAALVAYLGSGVKVPYSADGAKMLEEVAAAVWDKYVKAHPATIITVVCDVAR